MGKDLNQCNFIGRLGKEIELKYTASGSAVANFSIACSDDYKDKQGQKIEQTNWINIVVFGKLAEICGQYLKQGAQVYISGKQVTKKWVDKEGNNRYTTEIVANDMQMLGGRQYSSGGQPQSNKQSGDIGMPRNAPASQSVVDDGFDDIPF